MLALLIFMAIILAVFLAFVLTVFDTEICGRFVLHYHRMSLVEEDVEKIKELRDNRDVWIERFLSASSYSHEKTDLKNKMIAIERLRESGPYEALSRGNDYF